MFLFYKCEETVEIGLFERRRFLYGPEQAGQLRPGVLFPQAAFDRGGVQLFRSQGGEYRGSLALRIAVFGTYQFVSQPHGLTQQERCRCLADQAVGIA